MKRLLLVEDDPSIRRYVALALEDEGLDTLDEAGTLQSALACLRERSYDLVLTDLMLPDGHGTDLLEALRDDPALRQGAQLVAFSAGVAPSMRQRLFDLGAARILEKPVSLQALLDCVRAGRAGAGRLDRGRHRGRDVCRRTPLRRPTQPVRRVQGRRAAAVPGRPRGGRQTAARQ